jgi:hypothetical protein
MTYNILKNIGINFDKLFVNCLLQNERILFIEPFVNDIEAIFVLYQILHINSKINENNTIENFIYKQLLYTIIKQKCDQFLTSNNINLEFHLEFYNSVCNYIDTNFISLYNAFESQVNKNGDSLMF